MWFPARIFQLDKERDDQRTRTIRESLKGSSPDTFVARKTQGPFPREAEASEEYPKSAESA
jgi:hypothetical protein